MASGFARFAKANSTHSLGSFVDIASAASSEFEPVDLEDLDLSSTAETTHQRTGKPPVPPSAAMSDSRASIETDTFAEDKDEGVQSAAVRQIVDPLHDGLQNFEQATQKAAEAAKDFTSKLWTSSTVEAKSSVMRLAGDVSSWWANLDPSPSSQDQPQDSARSAEGNEEVQELFSLSSTEELMERFSCTLIQTVDCTHNTFSQPQQIRSPGKLYITDKHTCFKSEGCKFALPHSDIKEVSKESGGKSQSLRLGLMKAGEYVTWEGFKGSNLEDALALLEHLTAT